MYHFKRKCDKVSIKKVSVFVSVGSFLFEKGGIVIDIINRPLFLPINENDASWVKILEKVDRT